MLENHFYIMFIKLRKSYWNSRYKVFDTMLVITQIILFIIAREMIYEQLQHVILKMFFDEIAYDKKNIEIEVPLHIGT